MPHVSHLSHDRYCSTLYLARFPTLSSFNRLSPKEYKIVTSFTARWLFFKKKRLSHDLIIYLFRFCHQNLLRPSSAANRLLLKEFRQKVSPTLIERSKSIFLSSLVLKSVFWAGDGDCTRTESSTVTFGTSIES